MALVYVCCFWFSLRLGAILCAVYAALKYILLLSIVLSINEEELRGMVEKFLNYIEYDKNISLYLVTNFHKVWVINIILSVSYIIICLIMCFGAVMCKPKLCYPFIVSQMVLLLFGLFGYTIFFRSLMNLASKRVDFENSDCFSLGLVVIYLTLGILFLIFEIYSAICIFTFIEVIEDLRRKVQIKTQKQKNNIFI